MKQPSLSELRDPSRYEMLAEIDMQDVGRFVGQYYYRNFTWVTLLHYLVSILILALWIGSAISAETGWDEWLISLRYAVPAFIFLLPLHEAIHGLTYRFFGSKNVQYHLSLRKLYAYAIAPDFVVSARQFSWVAILPFVVINTILILLILVFPAWKLPLLATLLLPTGGTSGDFALLNFVWLNRRREFYTFDSVETGSSYFYARAMEV